MSVANWRVRGKHARRQALFINPIEQEQAAACIIPITPRGGDSKHTCLTHP